VRGVVLLIVLVSCSWFTVRPAAEPPLPPGDCTRSKSAPTTDAAVAVAGAVGLAVGTVLMTQGGCSGGGDACGAPAAAGFLLALPSGALALLYGLSARYGYHHVDRCLERAAEPPAPIVPTAPPSTGGPAPYVCYSWVHGDAFATQCYRELGACETARDRSGFGHGEGDVTTCEPRTSAVCTTISRPPEHPDPEEHCYGSANDCERYLAYLARLDGFVTSACRGS
jgi:hypothetical protein